jgi:hypothetical protein
MAPLYLHITIILDFPSLFMLYGSFQICSLINKHAPNSSLTVLWMVLASLLNILSTRKPTTHVSKIIKQLLDPICEH